MNLAPPLMPAATVVALLALLLGLQPLTTDLYLPALPALTADLRAGMPQAQQTLSVLLLAFGLSQLVAGPLSDRFGRRPVLLVGLLAFTLASIGCAWAGDITALIAWRGVQGLAMGAGVVCARAIVRDLYTPDQGARVMSRALSGLAAFACLGPPLGGLLSDHAGWRAALLVLALFGAVALGLVLLRYRETLARPDPRATAPRAWLGRAGQVLRHPAFLAFSLLTGASYGGLFTILAASSFVYIQVLGWSKTAYGLALMTNALAYLGGTVLCRRLLRRLSLRRTVAWAGALSLAGGLLMALPVLAGWNHGGLMLLAQCLFMMGHGIHQPCGQTGAVGPFPQAAGMASALNGLMMMLAAFAMGQWLGAHLDGSTRPLALGLGFWALLTALCAWTVVRWQENHGPA